MKKAYRVIAMLLSLVTLMTAGVGCVGDKPDKTPTSSNVGTSQPAGTGEDGPKPYDVLFDGDEKTYWAPNTAEATLEIVLDEETEFNSITFVEQGDKITDYIIEAKINGEYEQIYRQDEMGNRECILAETCKAKELKLTVTMEDETGGICEMSLALRGKIDGTANFKNVVYYTASRLTQTRAAGYTDIAYATDLIFFDYGAWNKDGGFDWDVNDKGYDEAFFAEALKEAREVTKGRKVNMWFCLQNYNKKTTANTGELFATEKARNNLVDFAIAICKKYDLVGVDIDYEYPHNSKDYTDIAWANYDKFLQLASKRLHAEGLKLSCAMYPSRIQLSKEAIASIDYVNTMVYDYADSKGRHSSYYDIQRANTYFTELGFKPEQLVLGVPFYVKTVPEQLAGAGYHWVIKRWRGSVQSWMNYVENQTYKYYFNGGDMLRDKTYWAMSNGYAGIFNWCNGCDVGSDDPRSLSVHIGETIERFQK